MGGFVDFSNFVILHIEIASAEFEKEPREVSSDIPKKASQAETENRKTYRWKV